jgi:hypothetical protein
MLKIKPTSAEYRKIQKEITAKVNFCIPLIENIQIDTTKYIVQGLINIPQSKNKKNLEIYKTFIDNSIALLSKTTGKIVIDVDLNTIDYFFKNFPKQFIYQFLDGVHAKYSKNITLQVPDVILTEILKYLTVNETYGVVPRINSWFSNRILKDATCLYNHYTEVFERQDISFKNISELGNYKKFNCHFCKRTMYPYEAKRCTSAKCVHHPGVYKNFHWTCCWQTDHVEEWDSYNEEVYMEYRRTSYGCTRSNCRPVRFLE